MFGTLKHIPAGLSILSCLNCPLLQCFPSFLSPSLERWIWTNNSTCLQLYFSSNPFKTKSQTRDNQDILQELVDTRTSGPDGPLVLMSYAVTWVQDLLRNYKPMPSLINRSKPDCLYSLLAILTLKNLQNLWNYWNETWDDIQQLKWPCSKWRNH